MKTWRRWAWVLVTAGIFSVGSARAADLADAIPGNAKAAVILSNAKDLEKNIRSFAQAIGTPLPEGLGVDMAAQMSGLAGVWQIERGAAVVVTAAEREGVAVVLPVADAKAALKQLNATADGDFYKLTLFGSPSVALPKDGVLVIGPSVKAVEPFKTVGKSLASQLQSVDKKVASGAAIFAYVNVPEFKDLATAGLDFFDQTLKQPIAQAAQAGGNDPAMMGKMLDLYSKGLRQLVAEAQSFSLGLSVTGDRIQLQKGLTFKPGTALAKYFQKEDTTPGVELIDDLPNRPFLVAFGWDADLGGDLWHDISLAFVESASKLETAQRKQIESYLGKMSESLESMNMLMDFTDEGMTTFGHYEAKDPAAFLKVMRDNKDVTASMTKAFSPGKMDVSMASKKVGKLDVTEFTYKFSGLPDEQMKMMKAMYGGDAIRMQMAVVDKQSIGMAGGAKGDPIKELIDPKPLVKEQRIRTALKDLPEKSGLVLLLDPASLVRFVKSVAEKAGPGIPLPLPTYDKPVVPIAIGVMGEKNGMIGRVVVRADTVREMAKPVLGR